MEPLIQKAVALEDVRRRPQGNWGNWGRSPILLIEKVSIAADLYAKQESVPNFPNFPGAKCFSWCGSGGMLMGMVCRPTEEELACLGRLLAWAVAEDLGGGDVTGALLGAEVRAEGQFRAREGLTVCGTSMLAEIARAYGGDISTTVIVEDGAQVEAGQVIASWEGDARAILAAERVALNFLQHLSGVATLTGRFVQAAAGRAGVYDTRKTTPGWRELEKYAVRVGGGRNHRMGLHDAILVKDNHLAILARAGQADPLAAMGARLGEARKGLGSEGFVEIEVDTLAQLEVVLALDVDVVLLDNMTLEQLTRAVTMRDDAGLRGRVALEASGGVTLKTVAAVAGTGVERIAVGAVTHSARAMDIGLDVAFD